MFPWVDSSDGKPSNSSESLIKSFLNINASCHLRFNDTAEALVTRKRAFGGLFGKHKTLWWEGVFHEDQDRAYGIVCLGQTWGRHWNASANTRFFQFSVLLFGIQSNRRISIRGRFHPSAYRPTELQLHILFLALLLFAESQLYSLKSKMAPQPLLRFVYKPKGSIVHWQVQHADCASCSNMRN